MFTLIVKELASHLFSPLTSADGLPAKNIDGAEQRIGFALPPVLRAFYELAGNHSSIIDAHSHILPPDKLYVSSDALIFCEENQRAVVWAIGLDKARVDDPPVVQKDIGEENWNYYCDTLSSFLLFTLCWQAVSALPSSASSKIKGNVMDRLNGRLIQVPCDTDSDERAFYGGGLVVCAFVPQNLLYAAAKDDTTLKNFGKTFDLELNWL